MADTPIMFLGITEGTWKWIVTMALPTICGWGGLMFWKIQGLATKADSDTVCTLMETMASEKGPLVGLQRSISDLTSATDLMLSFAAQLMDQQGIKVTAEQLINRRDGGGG